MSPSLQSNRPFRFSLRTLSKIWFLRCPSPFGSVSSEELPPAYEIPRALPFRVWRCLCYPPRADRKKPLFASPPPIPSHTSFIRKGSLARSLSVVTEAGPLLLSRPFPLGTPFWNGSPLGTLNDCSRLPFQLRVNFSFPIVRRFLNFFPSFEEPRDSLRPPSSSKNPPVNTIEMSHFPVVAQGTPHQRRMIPLFPLVSTATL